MIPTYWSLFIVLYVTYMFSFYTIKLLWLSWIQPTNTMHYLFSLLLSYRMNIYNIEFCILKWRYSKRISAFEVCVFVFQNNYKTIHDIHYLYLNIQNKDQNISEGNEFREFATIFGVRDVIIEHASINVGASLLWSSASFSDIG